MIVNKDKNGVRQLYEHVLIWLLTIHKGWPEGLYSRPRMPRTAKVCHQSLHFRSHYNHHDDDNHNHYDHYDHHDHHDHHDIRTL